MHVMAMDACYWLKAECPDDRYRRYSASGKPPLRTVHSTSQSPRVRGP
jgi:hypothetical protein